MRTLAMASAAAVMLAAFTPAAGADGLLVLKDGSAITVSEMTVRGGRVEVRLADSDQQVAYGVGDVDLEASGLAPEQPPTSFSTPSKQVRGGFEAAIAPPPGDGEEVSITDQDVEHVRPQRGTAEDEDEGGANPPARTTSLLVSNLQRTVAPGGPMTVTGTVTNSGDIAVSAIAITADAQDRDGASVGRGTTGISSTLAAGEASEFSIVVPVNGAVANLKVTAVAAVSEFTFEPAATPQADDEEDYGDDFDDQAGDNAFADEPDDDFED